MAKNEFNVLLDQREGHSTNGLEVGTVSLRGEPFWREGSTGLADSLDAVAEAGLHLIPTYMKVAGRAFAPKEDANWQQYHDTNAERDHVLDEKGILGPKGEEYVLDFQNGGMFVHTPSRIREAVEAGTLVNRALRFEQPEVDAVLEAINTAMKKGDYKALQQILHGERMAFAGDYNAFLEASANPGFLAGLDATYAVVRPVNEARALKSGYQDTASQKENPDIIIASGGKVPAGKMLDKALSFDWTQFGSHHDGYTKANTGRVVSLSIRNSGVYGNRYLVGYGYGAGVAPEARAAFYSGKPIDPLAMLVNQAMRGTPVEHGNGVLLYVPRVQLKQ